MTSSHVINCDIWTNHLSARPRVTYIKGCGGGKPMPHDPANQPIVFSPPRCDRAFAEQGAKLNPWRPSRRFALVFGVAESGMNTSADGFYLTLSRTQDLVVRTQRMVPRTSERFRGSRPVCEGTKCQILTTRSFPAGKPHSTLINLDLHPGAPTR